MTIHYHPVLVTGAAGAVGSVGNAIARQLLARGAPVRAMVRREDGRAASLREAGAEIVLGDLTNPDDVLRCMESCRRVYFGMSIAPSYLEATVAVASAARALGVEVLVNMSQMTVSQMRIGEMTESPQQRQHWLAERALAWSNLSVITLRPTIFLQSFFLRFAAMSIGKTGTLSFPFGEGKTSPVSSEDVARVGVAVLEDPTPHIGRIYELTGPASLDMGAFAQQYSLALSREIPYVDVQHDEWVRNFLEPLPLSDHLFAHLETMARLHKQNRYDRLSHDVELLTGRAPIGVEEFVRANAGAFGSETSDRSGSGRETSSTAAGAFREPRLA